MKNSVVFAVICLMCISGFAQSNNSDLIALEKKVIAKAKQVGDPAVVTSSMFRLIALEGETSTYKDSLAYVYFSSRQYASCFVMADEVLRRDPKHESMLELKGISLESLGAIDKSLEVYQELFAISKSNYHGYNVAKLQLSMKKIDEAYATIQAVEKLNDEGKFKVNFNINQNHNQQIELIAAIHYLKGLIEEDLDKMAEAKLSFEKAVKIQPDFILAKDKADSME